MVSLLDVNFLVALAWPNHVHHELALRWFKQNQARGWATCPTTQSGFVRVSSNPRVLPEARTPWESVEHLRRIVALPDHVFWADDVSLAESEYFDPARLQGYRQVTDAQLVALSLRHKGRLATLDSGVRDVVPKPHSAATTVCLVTEAES